MFAALTLDREPMTLTWETFLSSLISWTQVVGGFAMLGLVLWLIIYTTARGRSEGRVSFLVFPTNPLLAPIFVLVIVPIFLLSARQRKALAADLRTETAARGAFATILFVTSVGWATVGYLFLLALYAPELVHWLTSDTVPPAAPAWRQLAQSLLWTVAGAFAIFAVLLPILADLVQLKLSLRRVWAIARLSFKEAVRRKVLWVFLALLLVVLFGSWFIQNKPEDQVRTYVQVVFLAMALVMLFLAALIAGFGIPDDIRQQTIHTVLTKPVHRFEIFLGRFLGYTLLMTGALVVVSALGLLYVLRTINPEAAEESLKAREPLYGNLAYQGTKDKEKGENVGREWEYRGYIIGKAANSTDPTQYAVWAFRDVPGSLAQRPTTRLEFALDIYRTHKGVEGQGVFCTFYVESWRFDHENPVMMEKYRARKKALEEALEPDVPGKLAEELGYYEFASKEIQDFHTQLIDVPAGVFANAARPPQKGDRDDEARMTDLQRRREWPAAPLRVRVRVDPVSAGQFVGMARRDLYFRLDTDDQGAGNKLRFCLNFFKGNFGLWLRLCLIIGLAVALSTYLSGVITLLTTAVLFVFGFFVEFITDVALRRNIGGGPIEATMRLLKRPGGEALAMPLDESASAQVATGIDSAFSWSLRRALGVIPDVAQYSFTDFVAEGVAISGSQMGWALWELVRYLLPWAVLAYYLLRWREVAGAT
jgi:ABC-type transport system involved in multi-copper enzyme maturation permease subunit